jgi:hypothetical protein
MTLRVGIALALVLCGGPLGAQQINTYTAAPSGPNTLTYGLPVPLPVESLTPVDGFRSYASLDARLQGLALDSSDLSAHEVGRTYNGRAITAYVVGDADETDVEGRPEAAFFINAVTHAREWAAPEVSTGTIERLIGGASDRGLVRYLLDNTRLVIIPVQNVDGFLQTQRYPTQAIIGGDPDSPTWPRDGRMTRKNMRDVDEVLTTFGDRLGGIDLNRNHPPFWATSVGSGGSSANPASLTYHGTGAHSEPENQALRNAAQLGPATRFRLGVDVHTFSRVFYSSNTARTRLNAIQAGLVERLRTFQLALSGANYDNVPDPPNRGIGAAAEYFAYEWLVPAWTLELEPRSGPQEYGGLAVNHGGFILPAQEARRVRDAWAETHALAFYIMAGPPHLARVRIYDAQTGVRMLDSRQVYDNISALRRQEFSLPGPLVRGRRYRAEFGFSKPMRWRDAAGVVVSLPGSSVATPSPAVAIVRDDGSTIPIDTAAGEWLVDPARVLRYRDDTFAVEFTAPDESANFQLRVDAVDMVGQRLDADPGSPADWSSGAWSQWEDGAGVDGDSGGPDSSTRVVVATAPPGEVELLEDRFVLGEGDATRLRARRTNATSSRVDLVRQADAGVDAPTVVATWMPNESGERSIPIVAPDDLLVQDDRTLPVTLAVQVDGTERGQLQKVYRVLDNDRAERVVLVAERPVSAAADAPVELIPELKRLGAAGTRADLVLRRDLAYSAVLNAQDGFAPAQVAGDVAVFGNGASVSVRDQGPRRLVDVAAPGALRIDALTLFDPAPPLTSSQQQPSLFDVRGRLSLQRSWLRSFGRDLAFVFSGEGALELQRTTLSQLRVGGFFGAGLEVELDASSLLFNSIGEVLRATASDIGVRRSSLLLNQGSSVPRIVGSAPYAVTFEGTLLQDLLPGPLLDPPGPDCGVGVLSAGFNIYESSDCPFNAASDQLDTPVDVPAASDAIRYVMPNGAALDQGGACTGVDQRGAPRPQRSGADLPVACDTGALEAGIDPYRGIWQPARSGHGVEIHTAGNQLLLVWYTYADDGQPTSYQAVAPLTGPHWEADLLLPRRDVGTGVVSTPVVGRVTLDFSSDTDAMLGWRFDARGTTGSERIRPSEFAYGEPRSEVSGVWYPPAESGYGATVTRRGEVTALVLYYYDAQGRIRWVLGAGDDGDALELAMQSYTGFCPDCDAATMPVVGRPAGSVLVHFLTPERARLDTQVTYPGANGGQWNRGGAALIPLNDLVDNSGHAPQP